jgi:hypothetical protein
MDVDISGMHIRHVAILTIYSCCVNPFFRQPFLWSALVHLAKKTAQYYDNPAVATIDNSKSDRVDAP